MLKPIQYLFIVFLLLISMEGSVLAEEKIVSGRIVVSFTAEDDQKLWVVNALEQNVYNDLSGYSRAIPVKKSVDENRLCKTRKIDCILNLYQKLEVDALMLGTVDQSDIDYETYDVQNKSLVESGSIDIGGGSSLLKLRLGAFNAFKPFIEKGGILEKRQYDVIQDEVVNETNDKQAQEKANRELKDQVFISMAIFACLPYLLSLIGKPRRHPERGKLVVRRVYPFIIISLSIIGYLYLLESGDSKSIINVSVINVLSLFDGYHWILTGLGGAVWGYFLIVNIKIIIPHLQGIERVRPNILFPLFQSLLMTILLKVVLILSFYVGFFYGVFHVGQFYSIDQEVIVLLLFPIAGLFIVYWAALMLDIFAMSIDVKLSSGDLDYKNVWNAEIRNYFIAHLKRNGVVLDRRLVDDVVFLAGQNKGVGCYGGGFSRPRIAIDKGLIKFALGGIDDFNPEQTADYTRRIFDKSLRQNSVFKIVANLSGGFIKKRLFKSRYDKKRIANLASVQKYFQRDLESNRNKPDERPADVMQGVVIPRLGSDDDIPTLMPDNGDDLEIVEAMLKQNNGDHFHYNPDAEVDDASEKDKDFLFGAILHKFGELLRHEHVFNTLYYYFRPKKAAKGVSYNYPFSKYFAVVADTFVVINFGLNHLMQYLHYQATNISSYLTIKGMPSEMLRSQDQILISAKEAADERKPRLIRTDELERIAWLSRFCQGSFQLKQGINTRMKKLVKWSSALAMVYLASIIVFEAYDYHPRYLQIIEDEKQEIAEAIKKAKEKEKEAR